MAVFPWGLPPHSNQHVRNDSQAHPLLSSQDLRLVFRLQRQQFIELVRNAGHSHEEDLRALGETCSVSLHDRLCIRVFL